MASRPSNGLPRVWRWPGGRRTHHRLYGRRFPKLIAFHKPQIGEVVRETPTSLWGKRDGYEIKVDQDRRGQDDPYKDRNKVVIWQTV